MIQLKSNINEMNLFLRSGFFFVLHKRRRKNKMGYYTNYELYVEEDMNRPQLKNIIEKILEWNSKDYAVFSSEL